MWIVDTSGSANGVVTVSSSGNPRVVTVQSITGSGTIGIHILAGTAADLAGNQRPGLRCRRAASWWRWTRRRPRCRLLGQPRRSRNHGPVSYTVTYADANFDFSTLSPTDIGLNRTGTANGTVSVVTNSLKVRTVVISSIIGDGTLGISITNANTGSDLAGNGTPTAGPSTTFQVDNTAPIAPILFWDQSRHGPVGERWHHLGKSACIFWDSGGEYADRRDAGGCRRGWNSRCGWQRQLELRLHGHGVCQITPTCSPQNSDRCGRQCQFAFGAVYGQSGFHRAGNFQRYAAGQCILPGRPESGLHVEYDGDRAGGSERRDGRTSPS